MSHYRSNSQKRSSEKTSIGNSYDTLGNMYGSVDDEDILGSRGHYNKKNFIGTGSVPTTSELEMYTDKEYTDDFDSNLYHSADEFDGRTSLDRQIRNGRQRKKIAARTKGGEFQAKRKKRRVYVCCVASEIDIQKLHEHIVTTMITGHKTTWKAVLYGEALYVAKTGNETFTDNFPRRDPLKEYSSDTEVPTQQVAGEEGDMKISEAGSREVYIFEFGSVVLWGFSRGEELRLLDLVRDFSTKLVGKEEFESCVDDIAFVASPDTFRVVMSNDVISLPDDTTPKQRLAVSFAIAQSTVLAIYENRIDSKVAAYKYIPERLSTDGKIQLSMRQIGRMIGDIFVIRHDLNLHSYILDVPDFFWEENKDDDDFALYKMIMRYMEMDTRVEVLNKRLDMLRDLLDMLQQQMENAHASKLEWIVIWLIVVEVIIEVISLTGAILGWWSI